MYSLWGFNLDEQTVKVTDCDPLMQNMNFVFELSCRLVFTSCLNVSFCLIFHSIPVKSFCHVLKLNFDSSVDRGNKLCQQTSGHKVYGFNQMYMALIYLAQIPHRLPLMITLRVV